MESIEDISNQISEIDEQLKDKRLSRKALESQILSIESDIIGLILDRESLVEKHRKLKDARNYESFK